jgi:hypothetical protein
MSSILIIIVFVVFILTSSLIVIYQIFVPRGNPSKLISDIFKIKRDVIKLNDKVKVDNTILRWRVIAGILTGLVALYILRPSMVLELSHFYPWAYHVFWPLLFLTIIVLIVLGIKERKQKFDRE